MRAAVIRTIGSLDGLAVEDVPDPLPGPGAVVVDLVTAGLNRRDLWNLTVPGRATPPAYPGSDGAGIVAAVGPGAEGVEVGQEVIMLPSLRWGDDEAAPGPDFEILGIPTPGTHAEQIRVPAENVVPRPARLSWEESAALPLAGLTAWRALVTQGGVGAGSRVLVTGASGGVSTFLVQIAAALGAEVWVTTSSAEKLERARALGAAGGVDRRAADWDQQLLALAGGRLDVAIDSSGADWPRILSTLRLAGRLVAFGRTASEEGAVPVGVLIYGQQRLQGTTMGSPREFAALVDHVGRSEWRPVVDSVLPLEDVRAAYARLDAPDRFGNVVLRVRDAP